MPNNLQDFIQEILSNVVFLGAVSSAITGALWLVLGYFGVFGNENWKRLVSLVLPFIVAYISYGLGLSASYFVGDLNGLYHVTVIALEVVLGKQLIYTGYKATLAIQHSSDNRHLQTPGEDPNPTPADGLPVIPSANPHLPTPLAEQGTESNADIHGGDDYASSGS